MLFWLPILNAFYDVHAELSVELKNAYLTLIEDEDSLPQDEITHLDSIRTLIQELSDLSTFDIAEHFFAQSYAMPPDFFSDLLFDLFSIEEGQDIGLLALIHPEQEVRDVAIATLDALLPEITLSSKSLSRLKSMAAWYPAVYQDQLNRWIREQRKKEVIFNSYTPATIIKIFASEVDGGGAQGIFLHIKRGRKHRLCGLLIKYGLGIKDVWMTPYLSNQEIKHYQKEVFDDSMMLRPIDLSYLQLIVNHFLAVTVERGSMPDLHLLEMQEELDLVFLPQKIDLAFLIEEIGVKIHPFTEDILQGALKRTKQWAKNKRFTESWFVENANIDKLVNRNCSFVNGVKTCRFEDAMQAVFEDEFEKNVQRWVFHFIWITLWLKSNARKNEKLWQDSFLIAYAMYTGIQIQKIPIMHEICYQTVVNSIETMQDRKTYLSQE